MIAWTDAARQTLEDYCQRTRENLRGSGVDVEEVVEDLRRHVEEEVRAASLSTVTEDDIRRILNRIGETAMPLERERQSRPRTWLGRLFLFVAVVFGVLLPAATLAFEMFTGISAGVLFDPIPSWFHVAAIALVPAVNLWFVRILVTEKCRLPRLVGWLGGAAAGVAVFYSILYLPFAPFAGIGIIYFGLGLVPLSPYLALLFTILLWSKASRSLAGTRLGRFWPGFSVAFMALVLLLMPTMLTYYGLSRAVSDEPSVKRAGVSTLQRFGDEELLLRYCYGLQREREWDFDLLHEIACGNTPVSTDQAREIYFRVTGRPFNIVPPPALYTRLGRWNMLDEEFTWDEALGGEAVAGRVKGLSLQASRMDAVAEPDAATVYCEWTLEFKNVSKTQREARAQISLPPGGVVSRLTLWVNGEEREAAFSGRSRVREAYQQVAVVQRHDPVLVTTCGPDRVLMQCFPVPPNGGTMKVRLGITSPLVLESFGHGRYVWPEFLERNFKLTPELKHAVWMESPQNIAPLNDGLTAEQSSQRFSLHGALADGSLGGVIVERSPDLREVWTPVLESNQIVRQRIVESSQPAVSKIVFVIDGSVGMSRWKTEIAKAVSEIPPRTDVAVIVAGDEPFTLEAAAGDRLQRLHFVGGRDNLPALERAFDLAAASDNCAVIWIHDTQPVLLSSADGLRQRLERSLKAVPIYDAQLEPGPNRIAEKLDGLNSFRLIPRCTGSTSGDLENVFNILSGKTRQLEFIRDRIESHDTTGRQVSRHIERLWARDEAARLADARRRDDAARLAASHQVVTPFSGAVVLENKQQYAQNNLTPADPSTVPVVPEPETWGLLVLGTVALLWFRFRQ